MNLAMQLLHLDSSPLGTHSASRLLGAELVQALCQPGDQVAYRDLVASPLPHWTPDEAQTPESQSVLAQFEAADLIVIGAPMYNFSLPSQLKAWMDRVAVAGRTFRYTAQGPEGLAGAKRLWIVATRGGEYPANSPMDFQVAYLRAFFGFLGIPRDHIHVLDAQGLARGPEPRQQALDQARARIAQLPTPKAQAA